MNLEQVAHYIAHPQQLGIAEAPALKSLSEKYPYASVFSLLYLTALANGKSTDLDAALQQHAYRLSDRTQLYHLLHPSVPFIEDTEEDEMIVPNPEPITVPSPEPMAEDTGESVETDETSVTEAVDSEPEETVAEEQVYSDTTESAEISDITDFDVLTEAFTREQLFEIDEPVAFPSFDEEELYEDEVSEEETLSENNESESVSETEETPNSEAVSTKEQPVTDGKRSFTSWLKSASNEHSESIAPTNETIRKTEKPVEKAKVEEIIDTFIKEEPSITRSKTEFFSPSKKAKESLDEEAVPVSETLAKIFAAQGNYPKAIHVYHQLMLSFPEKKSLFAVQIEALKKKITT